MEFPELGSQCSVKECQTLDFLPIECSYCHMIFCKDHSQTSNHNCTAVIDNVVVEKKVSLKINKLRKALYLIYS